MKSASDSYLEHIKCRNRQVIQVPMFENRMLKTWPRNNIKANGKCGSAKEAEHLVKVTSFSWGGFTPWLDVVGSP